MILYATAGLLMGTRLVINGVNSTPSTINLVISTSHFENQIKVTLPANSTISLQMFTSIVGIAILIGGGAGACLTIIRRAERRRSTKISRRLLLAGAILQGIKRRRRSI